MLDQVVTFGRYRLDPRGGLVFGNREVRLTPKALALLCFIANRPGRLFTKDELFAELWPDTTVGDAALVTCIQEVRKALRDDARHPRYIETLHRRGYRFIGKPVPQSPPSAAPQVPSRGAQAASAIVVGREAELQHLHDGLIRARAGERQIVFVTGEPGIGKTSLVRNFVSHVTATDDIHLIWGQSVEHFGTSEPYLPLIEALVRSCRGPGGDRLQNALDRLAPTWLAQMPSILHADQLRDLRRRTAGVTRERMLRELTDALEAMTEQKPVVFWLEDLHWSDVSTIDWLASFARRPEPARVLFIGTYRPADLLAAAHPRGGIHDDLRRHGHCRQIALPPLTKSAVDAYLKIRFVPDQDNTEPLSRLATHVHQHTDGSPLFMVGVLDDLVDRGVLMNAEGRWAVGSDIGSVELGIPRDLQRFIERQLARLDPAKRQVLDVASVVGATFSAAAVAAGAGIAVGDAEMACCDVARRYQIINAAGTDDWPDGTIANRFAFHHALYREALYAQLPVGRRVELHRRIGLRLEQAHENRTDEIAGELAMHFECGRDIRRTIHYLHRAGVLAGDRGAARESATYIGRALDLTATLPNDKSRDGLEAELRIALCVPLRAIHGYGSAAVEACALKATALANALPDFPGRFAANRIAWNVCLMRHPVPLALDRAHELMDVARAAKDPAKIALAHRALGTSLKLAGKVSAAADVLVEGASIADGICDDDFAAYGEHPGMVCRVFAGWVKALMGQLDEAARQADDAIAHARQRKHAHDLVFALISSGLVYIMARQATRAAPLAAEALALAREYELPQWFAFGLEIQGWATLHSGDQADGIRLQEEALAALRATGAKTHSSRMLAHLAESYLIAGQPDNARLHLDAMLSHVEAHGERYYAAELPRLQARLLELEGASPTLVEAHLLMALDTARKAGTSLHALRAATCLARFRMKRGKCQAAGDTLAPLLTSVTGGPDWPDVVQARAALVQRGS